MAVRKAGKATAPAARPRDAGRTRTRARCVGWGSGVDGGDAVRDPRPLQRHHLLRGPARGGRSRRTRRLPPRRRHAQLRRPSVAGQPDRQRLPGAWPRARAARALPAPRLAGVPGRVLGGDQDRRGAGAAQHHAARPRLSLLPERQPGPHPGGVRGPLSRGRTRPGRGALPGARGGDGKVGQRRARLRRAGGAGLGPARGGRNVEGRCRLLALLLRLHRLPEGRRSPPARHGRLL